MSYHEYISTQETINLYPFSKGQLSYYLSHRHKNGLQSAVRKIGKRLYLRRDLLEKWIESQAVKGGIV